MLSDNHSVWLGVARLLPTSGARDDAALKMEGSYRRSSVERSRSRRRDDGVAVSSHGSSSSSNCSSRRDRPRSTPSISGGSDGCARWNDRRAGSARQIQQPVSGSFSEVGSCDSGSRDRPSRGSSLRFQRAFSSPAATMDAEEMARMRFVQELQQWVGAQQAQVDHAGWGQDMGEVELYVEKQTTQHSTIVAFQSKLEEAKEYENDISQYYKMRYSEHLGVLHQHYQILLVSSERRLQNLECLRLLVTRATELLLLLNQQEETELSYDWSDRNPNMSDKSDAHAVLMKDLEKMELTLNQIHKHGEHWLQQGHPAGKTIEALLAVLQVQWGWVLQLCLCVGKHLLENTAYFQFFRDALDAEQHLVELHSLMQKQRASSLGDYRDLKRTSKVITERLEEVEIAVGNLSRKSTQVVQLKPRRPDHAVTARLPIKAICDYKQDGVFVCVKDQAYFLQDNTRRVCWRVLLPSGTQATVPAVCYIILPPNSEAIAASQRLQEMLNDVRRLWRQVHADTEAALLWHALREEVTTVHTWTLAAFKRMKEEEHMGVMSSLEEHYEEFERTQSACEILGGENYAHMEANVWATRQHYKNLLKAIGQAYTPPPVRVKPKPSLVGVERRGGALSPRSLPRDAGDSDPAGSGASQSVESLTGNEGASDNAAQESAASALDEDPPTTLSGAFNEDGARAADADKASCRRAGDNGGTPADKPEHNPRRRVQDETVVDQRQERTIAQEFSSSSSSSKVVTKSTAQRQEDRHKNAEITAQIEKLKSEMAKMFGDKACMEEEMSQLRGVAAETQRLKERAEEEAARQRVLAERAVREKRSAEEKVLALARAEKEAAALYRSAMSDVESLRLKAEEALRLKQEAEKEAHRLSRLRKEAMEIKQISRELQQEGSTGNVSGQVVRAAQARLENVKSLVSQVEEATVEADRQTAQYQRQLDEVHRLKALAEQEAAARARVQAEAESLRREAEAAAQQRGQAETQALRLQERAEREMERQRGFLEETVAQKERAERELARLRALLQEMRGQKVQLVGEKEELQAEIRDVTMEKERVESELQTLRAQVLEMHRSGSAGPSQHQETQYEITQCESGIPVQVVEDEHRVSARDVVRDSSAVGHAQKSECTPGENNVGAEKCKTQVDINMMVNHNVTDDNLAEANEHSGTSDLFLEQQNHVLHLDDISQPSQDNISDPAFEECAPKTKVETYGSNQTADEITIENNSEENDSTSTSDDLISKETAHEDIEKPCSEGDDSETLVAENIILKPNLEEGILVTSGEEAISKPEIVDNTSRSNVMVSVEDTSQPGLEEDASKVVEVKTTFAANENVTEISVVHDTVRLTLEEVISTSPGNESTLKSIQSLEENVADEDDGSDESPRDDSNGASITNQNVSNTQADKVNSHPAQDDNLSKSSPAQEESISKVSATVEESVTNVLLEERVFQRTQEEVTSLPNQDTIDNSAVPAVESYTVKSTLNSPDLDSSLEDITSNSSLEDTSSHRVVKGRSMQPMEGNISNTSPEDEISNPFLENISSQSLKENISKPTEDSRKSNSLATATRSSQDETVIPGQAVDGINVSYVRAVNGCNMLEKENSVEEISDVKVSVESNKNDLGSRNALDNIDLEHISNETNIEQQPSQEIDVEILVDRVETERDYVSSSRLQADDNEENTHNNREPNALDITMDANIAQTSADAVPFAEPYGLLQAVPEQRVSVTDNELSLEESAYDAGQSADFFETPRVCATPCGTCGTVTDTGISGLMYGGETGLVRQTLRETSVADVGKRRAATEHDCVRSSSEASEETIDADATLAKENLPPLSSSSCRLPRVSRVAGLRQTGLTGDGIPGHAVLFQNAKSAARASHVARPPSEVIDHATVRVFDKRYRAEKMGEMAAEVVVQDRSCPAGRPSKNASVPQSKKKSSVFQGDSLLDNKIKCMKSELELLLQSVSETTSTRLHIPPANERLYRDEYDPCLLSSVSSACPSTFTPGLSSATQFSAGYEIPTAEAAPIEDRSSWYRDSQTPAMSMTCTFEGSSLERKPLEVTLPGLRAPVTLTELVSSKVIDRKTATQIKSGAVTLQEASRRLAPYLQGNKVIGGLYVESVRERVSIYHAIRRRIIRPGSGLQLLEAQAATGFIVEPETRRKLSVDDAVRHGVIGREFYDKLLSAEQAVTGYTDPITGERLSLFQAMRRGLIVRVHGLRLLEAQVATGGIIDPTFSHRLPLEVACARGLVDRDITRTLADLSDDNKGFFDPNTDENLTYTQLQRRCVPDPGGDLLLLPVIQNPQGGRVEAAELQLAAGKVKVYRDVNSLYRKIVPSAP